MRNKSKRKTILINGIRYYADKPESCRKCFFWKKHKVGCILGKQNCYYLAEAVKTEAIVNVADIVTHVTSNMPQFDVQTLTDYEQMKDTLTMQLIPVAGNELHLNELPHQVIEDMVLV